LSIDTTASAKVSTALDKSSSFAPAALVRPAWRSMPARRGRHHERKVLLAYTT